jgi:hypothetical protein
MRYLLFCLLLLATATFAAKPFEVDTQARVIAIGDIHGAYSDFVSLLQELEVIDDATNWRGGETHLVSLGDLIDRGPGSREVVELLMKLDHQAAAAGGAVHVVLGNHEVMVMSGDFRYVSAPEFAAFAADETAAERQTLLAEIRADKRGLPEEELQLLFEKSYPPGYLGLQKAYAPGGALGSWLMELPLVLRVNDKLYIHGGISAVIAEQSLAKINKTNKDDLARYLELVESLRDAGILSRHVGFEDRRLHLNAKAKVGLALNGGNRPDWLNKYSAMVELESAFIFSERSPVWYRGTAMCHPYAESFNTERLLKRAGARQLVIGHTPNPQGVIQRLDGQVIRLDTGMLKSVYDGKPSALVQQGGNQYIHYLGNPSPQQPLILDRSLSRKLWQLGDAELEDILGHGEIIESEYIGTGITKPKRLLLRKGDIEQSAVFKYEDTDPGLETAARYHPRRDNESDRYQYDVAAYRLDRMIDLQMVPVTVLREVDGQEGAVGAWIPAAINERDRLEQDVAFDGYCDKSEQYRLRFLFDTLLYNEDRNLTNIMWTKKDFMLTFIDHSKAFRSLERRPKQLRKVSLRLSDLFRAKLLSLTVENLNSGQLARYLHPRQIEAILARRDLILIEAVSTDP